MNEEGKRGCGPLFIKAVLAWMIFFFGVFVGLAKGSTTAAEMDKPVAEQVIRALVEAAAGNEWDSNMLANTSNVLEGSVEQSNTSIEQLVYPVDVSGIYHLAGINLDQVMTLNKPKRWTTEEAQMLVTLAMAEAEGEDIIGKALVIMVVLNRVESDSFPDTIEDVIFDPGQFSPVAPGHRYYKVTPNADCWEALEMVEHGWDESQGALYFERNTERSTWHSRNLVELYTHGNHTFYTEDK